MYESSQVSPLQQTLFGTVFNYFTLGYNFPLRWFLDLREIHST